MKPKDLTGRQFGKLRVIEFTDIKKHENYNESLWKCICECGTVKILGSRRLLHKHNGSKSCGCQRAETIRKVKPRQTHGKKDHRLYQTWKQMRQRCMNPNSHKFPNYGALGVKVCKEWDDFEIFLKDMELSYKEGLTLDRINPFGNYEPSNCKWSTPKEQANNTRKKYKM